VESGVSKGGFLAKEQSEPIGESGSSGKGFSSRANGFGGTKGRRRGASAPRIVVPPAVRRPLKPSTWRVLKMLFNLGAFLAGASAGYFFSKAENQFTRYGKHMMSSLLKNMGGGEDYGPEDERRNRFSDRGGSRVRPDELDPMGEFSEESFREEDQDP
jgi:hypothetical protein